MRPSSHLPAATYFISEAPQILGFNVYPELTDNNGNLGMVSVTRWKVEIINGRECRQITGRWRYGMQAARDIYRQSVKGGFRPYTWAD